MKMERERRNSSCFVCDRKRAARLPLICIYLVLFVLCVIKKQTVLFSRYSPRNSLSHTRIISLIKQQNNNDSVHVLYVFFFVLFSLCFFVCATTSIQNPGWILLLLRLDPRAVQGSITCCCRHPNDEGAMQLRKRRRRRRRKKRGREMTEREATKKRRKRHIQKLSLLCVCVCVLRRTKHTKLLLIVSGKREKKNACATVDEKKTLNFLRLYQKMQFHTGKRNSTYVFLFSRCYFFCSNLINFIKN